MKICNHADDKPRKKVLAYRVGVGHYFTANAEVITIAMYVRLRGPIIRPPIGDCIPISHDHSPNLNPTFKSLSVTDNGSVIRDR